MRAEVEKVRVETENKIRAEVEEQIRTETGQKKKIKKFRKD